jgi:hypothetical protein
MNTYHRTTTALLTILTISLIPQTGPAPADSIPSVPVSIEAAHQTQATPTESDGSVPVGIHTVHGADRETMDRIETALAAFADAGLNLPQLSITVYTDLDGCDGFAGFYRRNAAGDQINLCPRLHPDRTILHELAHAWEAHVINDTTRNTFLELHALDTWWGPEILWKERGGEQAAETIAKGLRDRPYPAIHLDAIDLLETGYQLLTGRHSPRYNNTPNPQINELTTTTR